MADWDFKDARGEPLEKGSPEAAKYAADAMNFIISKTPQWTLGALRTDVPRIFY